MLCNCNHKLLDPQPPVYVCCRYSAPFREEVTGWIVKLSTVSEIVEQWLMVQNMWMYMEAVFSGALSRPTRFKHAQYAHLHTLLHGSTRGTCERQAYSK